MKDILVRGGRGDGGLRKVIFFWFGFVYVVGCMLLYCLIWKFECRLKCVFEFIVIYYVFFELEVCYCKILLIKIIKDCKIIIIK